MASHPTEETHTLSTIDDPSSSSGQLVDSLEKPSDLVGQLLPTTVDGMCERDLVFSIFIGEKAFRGVIFADRDSSREKQDAKDHSKPLKKSHSTTYLPSEKSKKKER